MSSQNRRVSIFIDAESALRTQEALTAKSERLKKSIAALTEGTEEFAARANRIKALEKQFDNLGKKADELKTKIAAAAEGTDEWSTLTLELQKVQTQANRVGKELATMTTAPEAQLEAFNAELAKTNQQLTNVAARMSGTVRPSIADMERSVASLYKELRNLPEGSAEFFAQKAKWQEAKAQLKAVQDSVNDTRTSLQRMGDSLKDFGNIAFGNFFAEVALQAMQGIVMFFQQSVQAARDLSYQIFDMQKFLGLSAKEAEALNKEIGQIKTVTPTKELREMAIAAGKLSVPTEQVKGFVEEMDKAQQALAGEFNGTAEETATKLGKLKGLFDETANLSWPDAMRKISGALLEVGASGAASADNVTEFTQRMGALGDLGPMLTQNFAIGAVLEEAGVNAEIAAGGISALLLEAGKSSEAFAKQIGITEEAFKKLINTSPYDALKAVAESMQGLDNDQVISALQRMNVGSQESVKVLSLLRDKFPQVEEKYKQFQNTFDEGTKTTEVQAERMKTFGAQVDMVRKEINAFVMSIQQALVPAMMLLMTTTLTTINIFRALPKFLKENWHWFTALGVSIAAFNRQSIISNALSLKDAASKKIQAIATSVTDANTKRLTFSTLSLNAAMRANPVGLVITAVALLAAGVVTLYNNFAAVRKVVDGTWEAIKGLTKAFFGVLTLNKQLADEGRQQFMGAFSDKPAPKPKPEFSKTSGRPKAGAYNAVETDEQRAAREAENRERQAELDKQEADKKKRQAAAIKSATADRIKAEKEAFEAIQQARLDLMPEGEEKELKLLEFRLKKELEEVKGSEAQKAEMRLLLEQKFIADAIALAEKYQELRIKGEQEAADAIAEIRKIDETDALNAAAANRALSDAEAQINANSAAVDVYSADMPEAARARALAEIEADLNAQRLENERIFLEEKLRINETYGTLTAEQTTEIQTRMSEIELAQAKLRVEQATQEQKEKEELAEAQKFFAEKSMSALGAIADFAAEQGREQTAFQKLLAATQIAIDTATSISAAIAGATKAANAGGAAAPFLLAGYIASMVGSVFGAMSQAKKLLATAEPPAKPKPTNRQTGYQVGGFTPNAASDAQPVGVVHANEYVTPAWMLRIPAVANIAEGLEAIRTGKSPAPTAQTSGDNSAVLAELRALRTEMANLKNMVFRGYVVYSDIAAAKEQMDNIEDTAQL